MKAKEVSLVYKRMAQTRHVIGHKLHGRGTAPLQERFAEVEDILERNRPQEIIGRKDCVYMRDDEDFSGVGISYDSGYVHDVKPIGPVYERDTYWVGVLQKRKFKDDRFRSDLEPHLSDDQVAANYWAGTASAKPVWEWVSHNAEVVGVAEHPTPVKPNATMLNALGKAAAELE